MERKRRAPWLERAAAAIGAALTAGLVAILAWEAAQGTGQPPHVSVDVERVTETDGGFIAEVRAYNHSSATAADVTIEGKLGSERSEATLDYVPGHSSRRAGLFFDREPRRGELHVRALGYTRP